MKTIVITLALSLCLAAFPATAQTRIPLQLDWASDVGVSLPVIATSARVNPIIPDTLTKTDRVNVCVL